ncbi:transposase [Lentzea jiangxiensis]|uniref:Transposase DDE domain-containing protein n=1 Tax=Lentzea jiangxiensis TaxID=641025 RepID=A0A1H0WY96_9PSEU|nr:transposase [Lentzea jiangxiensis]SDP95612.1 Transposase DDE domain-containing protein [Lentzea jiangxiensis]
MSVITPRHALLADQASDGYPLLRKAVATGTDVLWRVQNNRTLAVLRTLPDGSYLSIVADVHRRDRLRYWARNPHAVQPNVDGVTVRVIDATVTAIDVDGRAKSGTLRLITTLLNPETHPAQELVALYHQRWEAETAFHGLKVTLRGSGRVLRSRTVDGVRQELFGLLVVYQAARRVAAEAAASAALDPDRISLTVVLRTARHTVINAHTTVAGQSSGVCPRIWTAALDPRALGPTERRTRIWPRRIKRPIAPFAYNKSKWDQPMRQVTITSTIAAPTGRLTGGSTA